MPFLEQGTSTEEAEGRKYIFWKNEIYFANDEEELDLTNHGDLVKSSAKLLSIPLKKIDRDDDGRPMIEAGGTITIINGKFDFSVSTTTCNVIYSSPKALKEVKARAREILGAESVN